MSVIFVIFHSAILNDVSDGVFKGLFMIIRMVQIPASLALIICAGIATLAILSLFIVGTAIGSIKELFRFYLIMPGTRLNDYKMESSSLKGEVKKYFKLPSTGNIRGNRMIYIRGK